MDFLSILSYLLINIILPIAAISALIFLSMVLNNSAQAIKRFDSIADDIEHKLKILNGPLEAIVNIQDTFKSFGLFIKSIGKTVNDFSNLEKEEKKDEDR